MSRYNELFIFKARRSPLVMNVKGRVDFQRRRAPTWATFIHKLAKSNKVQKSSNIEERFDLFPHRQATSDYYSHSMTNASLVV